MVKTRISIVVSLCLASLLFMSVPAFAYTALPVDVDTTIALSNSLNGLNSAIYANTWEGTFGWEYGMHQQYNGSSAYWTYSDYSGAYDAEFWRSADESFFTGGRILYVGVRFAMGASDSARAVYIPPLNNAYMVRLDWNSTYSRFEASLITHKIESQGLYYWDGSQYVLCSYVNSCWILPANKVGYYCMKVSGGYANGGAQYYFFGLNFDCYLIFDDADVTGSITGLSGTISNNTTTLGSKIDALGSKIDALGTGISSQTTAITNSTSQQTTAITNATENQTDALTDATEDQTDALLDTSASSDFADWFQIDYDDFAAYSPQMKSLGDVLQSFLDILLDPTASDSFTFPGCELPIGDGLTLWNTTVIHVWQGDLAQYQTPVRFLFTFALGIEWISAVYHLFRYKLLLGEPIDADYETMIDEDTMADLFWNGDADVVRYAYREARGFGL